jgi:hypothetical protein
MMRGGSTHVLLDNLTDALLLEVFLEVLLDEELHRGTAAEAGALGVLGNGESSASGRLPDVLLVIVVLGGNLHLLGDEVGRVETDTELTCGKSAIRLISGASQIAFAETFD